MGAMTEQNPKIERYPDAEARRRIMDLIMAAGETLLENGAEVFRVQQTMESMARSLHLREFHAYVLTNGIMASAGTAEIGEVRNVPSRTVHLGRVAGVNELSRELAEGKISVAEAEAALVNIRNIPFRNTKVCVLAGAAGAFSFAVMFGGGPAEGASAALSALLMQCFIIVCRRAHTGELFRRMAAAAFITAFCTVFCGLWGGDRNIASIGALMLLTPGVSLTMGIQDFVHGDYLSGMIRVLDAILVAACLAIGTGAVMMFFERFTGGAA